VLEIGWGAVRERFRSRIYCVPGRIVEAVGGESRTQLDRADIAHHDLQWADTTAAGRPAEEGDGILTHLATRWTVNELGPRQTNVALDIEFQFANPVYAAMSGAVAGKVADVMIEAFEKRVRTELERGESEIRPVKEATLKGV
jgi:coenzyme Q-binding protein COQ10